MDFTRNEEVVLWPFGQDNTTKYPLHSNFCENVYVKGRNHVEISMSRSVV